VSTAVAQDPRPARPARSARPGLSLLAARILRTEIRHSAFLWSIPLLAVLFIYDPFRTAAGYPDLWNLRASVILNKLWPDCVPFAAGFCAWAGSREGRRRVGDLVATTARPAWTRQLCSLGGTLAWVLAVFLTGVVVVYVRTAQVTTWGGPPIWPVVAGVAALTAVSAVAYTLGALFPGRFTAPIVAVGISMFVLVAFSQAVSQGGVSLAALSPAGPPPSDDTGVFYHVPPDVSIVQTMFYAGVVVAAVGLLGLSPRTGGVGWRGALDAASAGGARLRTIATSVFAAGVAVAVAGFGLAGTAHAANGSGVGGNVIPVLHDSASGQPIPYTPVCAPAGGFEVCLHPAYQHYLSQAVNSFQPVMTELAGLPGAPLRATEVSDQTLPQAVLQNTRSGLVTGTPPVYEFSMDNALAQVSDPAQFQDGFRQDIVYAVIVGPITLQQKTGSQAQQAVMDGLLKAIGSKPYPFCAAYQGAQAAQCGQEQKAVMPAAGRFAALPAPARHAWLVASLPGLKAGRITLAQVP
jgi:hypothetical protein